jgi:hypothetical protein
MDGNHPQSDGRYRDLWLCFLSDQISAAELEQLCRDDSRLAAYVRRKTQEDAECSRRR